MITLLEIMGELFDIVGDDGCILICLGLLGGIALFLAILFGLAFQVLQ